MGGCCGGELHRPKITVLHYFPISGRAEPIRLALVLGRWKFTDKRLSATEWETAKENMPYNQVPVLVVDAKPIAQTKAILRYVGKFVSYKGKPLYPKDPFAAAQVDALIDAFDDLFVLVAPTYRIKEQAAREATRQRLFAEGGEANKLVRKLESALAESPTGFAVPAAQGLTLADLVFFCFFNMLRSGFMDGLGTTLFDEFPHLMKHKERIAGLPEVSSYYKDAKRSNPFNLAYYEVFQPGF